ncbi:MAG: ChbG/HpnK family deacetylase [Lachnospiraceae bacterium]|nr:ChbG/HpnK family deacetylase [Lachnospiraceae bacterium]
MSVLPNGRDLDACMQTLEPYRERIKVSIHFNLAEGHCVAAPAEVPLLVDERGMFHISFFKVLLWSFTGKRKELRRQIELEMKAQFARVLPYTKSVRVDSHQHYHMIPMVLKSILKAVEESSREIEFVRIPAEPLSPFLKHPELWRTFRPINLVKNLVLNVLNLMDVRILKPYRRKSAVFFGILLSGGMDLQRVRRLLPEFQKIADRKKLPLEILCHPGGVEQPESLMDIKNTDCVRFYTSEGRKIEKEMLMKIKESC